MGAGDGGIGVGHLVAVDKLASPLLDVTATLRHDDLGQRLQSQLACCLGACLALGLIGQVDILERGGVPAVVDAFGQFRREFILRFDGLEDGGTPFFQFPIVAQPLVDGLDRQFVQIAGCLFAVTADKRDGCSIVKQADGASHLIDGDIEFLGDERG